MSQVFEFTSVPKIGTSFTPKKIPNIVSNCLNNVWDLDCFSNIQKISKFGLIENQNYFSFPQRIRILDMPIKMAGQEEYRILGMVNNWFSLIKRIAQIESASNDTYEYYAYLTIDQSWVNKGQTQRHDGCHVDGFQGSRIEKKTLINRSYIVCDQDSPFVYEQTFNVSHLNDSKHNFFTEFDIQANKNYAWQASNYELFMMNAYTVHEAIPASQSGYRTFFRLSYDVKEFDRLGNTHNPLFDYAWNMQPRNIHSTLINYR